MSDTLIGDGCVVCDPGPGHTEHQVNEGMFGTGEQFTYRECASCGSLQIAEVPVDLARYYSTDVYYSFAQTRRLGQPWLRTPLVRAALRANSALYLRTGYGQGRGYEWAREAGIRTHDRILDLGCGAGASLFLLHLYGFRNLTGADPFLHEEGELIPGIPLLKKGHSELSGQYDWVTMNHSFEHVPDPRAMLRSVRRLLAPGGRALIRMPIMGQYAWRRYNTHWVQIDPPRHLVLYTVRAMHEIAASEGFKIDRTFYDSNGSQFWGSECVALGRPHAAGHTYFSRAQLRSWKRRAQRLNRSADGDQGGFVLSTA